MVELVVDELLEDDVVTVEVETSSGLVVGGLDDVLLEELVELLELLELVEELVLVDVLSVELVEELVLVEVDDELVLDDDELLVDEDVLVEDEVVELVDDVELVDVVELVDELVLVEELVDVVRDVLVEELVDVVRDVLVDELVDVVRDVLVEELVDVVRDVLVDELVDVVRDVLVELVEVVVVGRVQSFRQPSLSFELPSSHCSHGCLIPSPQNVHCPHELPTGRQGPCDGGGLMVLFTSSLGNLKEGLALPSHVSTAGSSPLNKPSPQTCPRAGPAPNRSSAITKAVTGAVKPARVFIESLRSGRRLSSSSGPPDSGSATHQSRGEAPARRRLSQAAARAPDAALRPMRRRGGFSHQRPPHPKAEVASRTAVERIAIDARRRASSNKESRG